MKYFLCILLPFISIFSFAQVSRFEKSNGMETATYFEAIQWYKELDKISPSIFVKEMGPTDAGYPLHLVLISNDKSFDPVKWHRDKKVVILINNGIHPGEPDGIDASMMLARDIIKNKVLLPGNVALAFIPVYNIGGCLNRNSYTRANQNGPVEYGFRGNSQNLDLNRDFTKSDSREARSFAQLFHYLNPDILIDNHVSDGADYQHTMTLVSTQYEKLGTLGKWMKEKFEPNLYKGMAAKGWDLIPYVNFETTDFGKGMEMFYDPPRYSSGYAALFNTMSYMPETHMLKPFKERVMSTYDLMRTFIEAASSNANELIRQRAIANSEVIVQKAFPLNWTQDTTRFDEIIFKGYEVKYTSSEATGLQKMIYDHQSPYSRKIKYYNVFNPENIVQKPAAYIIPRGWYKVADLLKLNNVHFSTLEKDTTINLIVYHIDDYKTLARQYEGHHKNHSVKISQVSQPIKFIKGDYFIPLNQANNRYIIEMLEPTGDDSFFAWNFFDPILQQKEGYSDYRWEDIAADVLKNDPVLREKLESRKKSDPAFAKNSPAILDFIYRSSGYYEKSHLRYPV
ncbi:MAG TPA: M14 family zinc carboxypeptidase, partial [Ferruginibacter sp.]|nr:M14 family zinc carboxypeptidase [Ferruginibacter sp.]